MHKVNFLKRLKLSNAHKTMKVQYVQCLQEKDTHVYPTYPSSTCDKCSCSVSVAYITTVSCG